MRHFTLIVLFFILVFTRAANAWTTSTFNNSLVNENLAFDYTTANPNMPTGLVYYYSFDEGSIRAMDRVDGNNLTIFGAQYTSGKILNGISYKYEAGKYANSTNSVSSNIILNNSRTINFWGKLSCIASGCGTQSFLSYGNTTSQFIVGADVSGNTSWYFQGDGGDWTTNRAIDSAFNMHTLVYDEKEGKLYWYVNGTSIGSFTVALHTGLSKLIIGQKAPAYNYGLNGTIDEIGIWNRTLNASEISALYNNGLGISYNKIEQNITRYLSIPSSVTRLFRATLNISSKIPRFLNSFNVSSYVAHGRGLWSDGVYFWIVDITNNKVFKADATFSNISEFPADWSFNQFGIWSNGSDFWVTDPTDNIVNHVTQNGSYIDNFSTNVLGSQDPGYIWGNGSDFWITDWTDARVYHTNKSGYSIGNFDTSSYLTNPAGIWGNGSDFWITDSYTGKVVRTSVAGTFINSYNISQFGINAPSGIWSNGNNDFFIVQAQGPIYEIMLENNPTNPSLYVNITHLWNYTGNFSQLNNKTSSLVSQIEQLLSPAYLIGSNYIIPFTFHSDTIGALQYSDLQFDNQGYIENSQAYNTTAYETSTQAFVLNITYDYYTVTASLVYNGTKYAGTRTGSGLNSLFTKTLDMPSYTVALNNSLYWEIALTNSSGTTYANLTRYNQTVKAIQLGLCNSTLSVPFINFTFKDEGTNLFTNGSIDTSTWVYYLGTGAENKSLVYSNTTAAPSHAFCFSPQDKTFNEVLTLQYSFTGYPQRRYYLSGSLSNSTTNKVLYMLSSSDGIYSSYAVQDGYSHAVEAVTVQVERQFSGVWTLIEQGTTDSSGLVTFWVNPNYDHRLTFSKTGYGSKTVVIRPTQSLYTLVLSGGTSNTNYYLKNIEWVSTPKVGVLSRFTNYTFSFNLTASDGNIASCMLEIRNLTFGLEKNATGCNQYGGNVSLIFNTGNHSKLFGYYYINFGSGYQLIKANDAWMIEDINETGSNFGLFSWLQSFKDLPDWGSTHNRREFSMIVGFFFLMIMLVGMFTFFTGYDFNQPGGALIVVWGLITLGSFAGIFTIEGISPFSFFNKYTIFMISTFLCWGYYLNWWRRANT